MKQLKKSDQVITKPKSTIIIRYIIVFLMLFLLILEIQRSWTGVPVVRFKVTITHEQAKLLNIGNYLREWTQFAYFTTLANIFLVIALFVSWCLQIKVNNWLKAILTTYMVITSLLFWTTSSPYLIWNQSFYFSFILVYEHAITTLVALFWFKKSSKDLNFKKGALVLLIFPLLYFIFTTTLYVSTQGQIVVYPFLNFENIFYWNLPKLWSIIISCCFIISISLLFLMTYWLLCKWHQNNKIKKL